MFPMKCMRCGRDTTEQQVFCDDCQADMARHPVKPDVAVYLPVRKPSEPQRKQNRHHKKELSAEELVPILRSRIWILSAAVVILTLMLGAAAAGVWFANNPNTEKDIPNIGQNYQTVENNNDTPSGG